MAYPAAQAKEGIYWSERALKFALAANLVLQICASISGYLFSTWFGPITIAGPIFYVAQLIANLLLFWIALGLELFTREMQIGTYVIAVAAVLLIEVGPGVQEDQNFQELIEKPLAATWSLLLCIAMLLSSIPLAPGKFEVAKIQQQSKRSAVLATARATSFVLNLTTSRAFASAAPLPWLIPSIIIKVVSGIVHVRAIVVQSTAVKQAVFVPLNTIATLFVNAITGIIVWEDWKVVGDWLGYVCVYLLFFLGICLLLGSITPLQETDPGAFRARWGLALPPQRRATIERIRNYGSRQEYDGISDIAEQSGTFRTASTAARERSASERRQSQSEAWKAIYRVEDHPSLLYGSSVVSVVTNELPEVSRNSGQEENLESSRKITDETMPCTSESYHI